MLIDSHAHLDMSQFDIDREEVIKRAQAEGIDLILNVGPTLDGSIKSIELAHKYDFIFAAVGIHPHNAKTLNEESYQQLEKLVQEKKVIAVGEIGLDYYYSHSEKDAQKEAFRQQIGLSKKYKKPIIVHSRDAKEDTLQIFKEENVDEAGGILHCFSGDEEMLAIALEMGFYISFAGQVTFKKAVTLQELVKKVPTEKLLIETDCPYLAPHPKRGKRCEPAFINYTAEKIASLRGVSIEDLKRVISLNFYNLFGLGEKGSGDVKISYQIRNSLYLNITNKCTNSCYFCARFTSYYVQGHNLKLEHEPTIDEILQLINGPKKYDEIVFCGFGEPTIRFGLIRDAAKKIKEMGDIKIRLNTNGHGSIINKRNILPEMSGLIDTISISLNAESSDVYKKICRPCDNAHSYENVCDFIIEAKKYIPTVVATVLDIPYKIDIKKCEDIAKKMEVNFKVRKYNMVGA